MIGIELQRSAAGELRAHFPEAGWFSVRRLSRAIPSSDENAVDVEAMGHNRSGIKVARLVVTWFGRKARLGLLEAAPPAGDGWVKLEGVEAWQAIYGDDGTRSVGLVFNLFRHGPDLLKLVGRLSSIAREMQSLIADTTPGRR